MKKKTLEELEDSLNKKIASAEKDISFEEIKIFEKLRATQITEPTNDLLIKRFLGELAFIMKTENYYAMFKHILEKCATAQLENLMLFEKGLLTDLEYTYIVCRIQRAKELAIKTHGEWTIKMLEQNKTQHTPRTFVSSVYFDIFGIELRRDAE